MNLRKLTVETIQQPRDLTEIVTQKSPYRVVPSPRQSELQQLASWFHQDWKLVFPDFYTGLRIYLDNLPAGRRAALGSELRRFVEKNQGASAKALKRLWLRLGAQGWQANLDIRAALDEFCRIIESKP